MWLLNVLQVLHRTRTSARLGQAYAYLPGRSLYDDLKREFDLESRSPSFEELLDAMISLEEIGIVQMLKDRDRRDDWQVRLAYGVGLTGADAAGGEGQILSFERIQRILEERSDGGEVIVTRRKGHPIKEKVMVKGAVDAASLRSWRIPFYSR